MRMGPKNTLVFFQVLDEIEEHGIKIYQLPDAESDEDEDFKEQTRLLKVCMSCFNLFIRNFSLFLFLLFVKNSLLN